MTNWRRMSAGPALDAILVTCDVSPWAEAQRVALLDALEALHCNVEVASWDEQRDWGSAAGIVVVSPFNTAPLHDEFLAWVERCEEQATLVNSAALLNLDSHRRYLFDLEAAGVPIVATRQVAGDAPWQFQRAVLRRFEGTVVMKPAVAASKFGYGIGPADSIDTMAHLEALCLLGDAVIQPYISTVDTVGVAQIVLLRGEVRHAVRKVRDVTVEHTVQPEEREVIAAALDALPEIPVAASVELVWVGDEPALLSFDLVGPNLHAGASGSIVEQYARVLLDTIHRPRIGVVTP